MQDAWTTVVNELAKQHGSLKSVPTAALEERGLIRLDNPFTGSWRIVPLDEFQSCSRSAKSLLWRRRGYIFAHDISRLRRMIDGHDLVQAEDIQRMEARAQRYINASIPPIFTLDVYTSTRYLAHQGERTGKGGITEECDKRLFPSVDFLIQFTNGSYQRRLMAQAAKAYGRGVVRDKFEIQPTTVQDVCEFRQLAFNPEGVIEKPLILETLDYIEERFQFQTKESRVFLREHGERTFAFLEEQLRNYPVPPRAPEVWDGNPGLVNQRRWYLGYMPEVRAQIIRAWIDSWSSPPTGQKNHEVFARLQRLFPEHCLETEKMWGERYTDKRNEDNTRTLERLRQGGDFRRIPEVMLVQEPWKSTLDTLLKQHVRAKCEDLVRERREHLFINAAELHTALLVPRGILLQTDFKLILDEFRLLAAQALTDEQFMELFGRPFGGRRTALGHTKSKEASQNSLALRVYLSKRYQALKKA